MLNAVPRRAKRSVLPWRVLLAMLAVAVLPIPTGASASASCASPYLFIDQGDRTASLAPGSSVSVQGRAFVRGCDDTGSVSAGAFGCESAERRTPTPPMRDVALVLKQGKSRWELGAEDAGAAQDNKLGHIAWQVTMPADLRPGRAVLIADALPRGRNPLDARLPVDVIDRPAEL